MRPTLLAVLLCLPAGAQELSPELEAARLKLQPAAGFKVSLWAAEPRVQNPVAIAFDGRGRLYVAEDFRRHTSTLDIHMRKEWLDDDLASRRHEEMVAYHRRRLGDRAEEWRKESERIRIVEDRAGGGRADHVSTFSEGYRELGEGIGAGVLVRGGDVYYTCIPNLWKLADKDGDGVAEVRQKLHTGFGVHLGASGHDMHGLRFGPDGKLYWSHGDRGFRVEVGGRVYDHADTGGVLRCNPDGSDFEVVCSGLRNPQELVFDDLGNLFTGDNNISITPDVGETCRWTHVVEGADYGWKIGYQFMPKGGAWCAEEQWKLEAGFQVPFVARLGHGPSGVTVNPGTGLSPKWDGHFFMCDYPGGIYTFKLRPKGAGFEMTDPSRFLWGINAPDVEFGPDGAIYAADWAGMWDKTDKGRIWRLEDPEGRKDPVVAEVQHLLAEGMGKREPGELLGLLAHRDQRVRQEAQFELAARKSVRELSAATAPGRPLLARIHALWALGQIFGADPRGELLRPLISALSDADAEIRAQALRVLGDRRVRVPAAAALLDDASARARYFAALAVGRSGDRDALPAVIRMLRENAGQDRTLQHAGIMALTYCAELPAILEAAKDPAVAVRMSALVALRKLGRPEVAVFLDDADPKLVLEASRAIYDQPIPEAFGALSRLLLKPAAPERALIRAVNAAFRLGDAAALGVFAAQAAVPAAARVEALQVLAIWEQPSGRDRLIGIWRPVPKRERAAAAEAVERATFAILKADAPAVVTEEALRSARALGVEQVIGLLWGLVEDPKGKSAVRVEALRGLAALGDARVPDLVLKLIEDGDALVAREAVRALPSLNVPGKLERLEQLAAGKGPLAGRQAAVTALASMKNSDAVLERLMDRLLARDWPAGATLELLEAAGKRESLRTRLAEFEAGRSKDDPLAAWRETLEGGDSEAGRRIFFERNDAQCVRCHKIRGEGGEVGPDLTLIAAGKTPDYLLEALMLPNKQIAQGFGQTAFQMENDAVEVGRIERETPEAVHLLLGDGQRRVLPKSGIKARKEALSAMPEDVVKRLSKRDLRDLQAWMQSLR